ncbi:MAG: non-canonical purine NTP diphosphatase [Cyclobacteriaceae bacterium]|nr:non-canonical purine NTP diphosphatase [Cyclobacteriaceae bacterium]
MPYRICFATNNHHKLEEVMAVLGDAIELVTLENIGCREDLPETQSTIEGNASQKSKYVWDNYHTPCFADDTGLEVTILNGAPGVYSARYAGPERNSEENISLLLKNLGESIHRNAQFKTVISLRLSNEEVLFEGIVKGIITHERKGKGGFGYDPVFLPDGYSKTLAEMTMQEKNQISHRAIAVQKLAKFLLELKD